MNQFSRLPACKRANLTLANAIHFNHVALTFGQGLLKGHCELRRDVAIFRISSWVASLLLATTTLIEMSDH